MNNRQTWSLILVLTFCLAGLAGLLGVTGSTAQATSGSPRYVATTGADNGTCIDPNAPCRTVQYAVDQAASGDEVLIATGVYTGVQARAGITQVVYISKTLSVRGGYRADFSARDPEVYSTTLNAQGQGRVVYATGPGITLTLEGLRVSGGDASGQGGEGGPYDVGGGLYVLQATTYISGNAFVTNLAHSTGFPNGGKGGGLYLGQSIATLRNNVVRNNTASAVNDGYGGGLFLSETNAKLRDNLIQENLAAAGAGTGYGGALYQSEGEANLTNNTILSNTAKTAGGGYAVGGGVHVNSGSATVVDNTFRGNAASRAGGSYWNQGGGLSTHNSQVLVTDNTFENNAGGWLTPGLGGGIFLDAGGVTLLGNTFTGNSASLNSSGWGGGVYVNNCYNALIRGNTFQGNMGGTAYGWGGGLDVSQSHGVQVTGNTFVDNAASSSLAGQGGGLVLDYADITLEDNLIQGNTADQGGGVYVTSWASYEILASWVNNAFINNRATAGGQGSGFYSTSTAGNVRHHLLHTTLARNSGGDGSSLYVDQGTVLLTNTLLYSHTIGVDNNSGVVTMTQTLWDGVVTPTLGTVHQTGSFTGTAAFAADGYHLTETSDAVDTGVFAGVGHDIDGERRPMGGGPDVGADEYPTLGVYLPLVLKQSGVSALPTPSAP
jgi:hypothetical protein